MKTLISSLLSTIVIIYFIGCGGNGGNNNALGNNNKVTAPIADIQMTSEATRSRKLDGTLNYKLSGVNIEITEPKTRSGGWEQVASAQIEGPGFVQVNINKSYHSIHKMIYECSPYKVKNCADFDQITDNSVYTVVLKDANGQVLNGEGYTYMLLKGPAKKADLNDTMFATLSLEIDGVSFTDKSQLETATEVNVSWTPPADTEIKVSSLDYSAETTEYQYYFFGSNDAIAELRELVIPIDENVMGSANSVFFRLTAKDQAGRKFITTISEY